MKKISIIMALFAVVFGLSSCENDKDPVYQQPTEFKLNTPALSAQYFELTPNGTVQFTCSQPDYGFVASANYTMQMALSEGGETYDLTPAVPTDAKISIKASDIATGMCVLRGISDDTQWVEIPAIPVYFRAVCQLAGHPNSLIMSNWVKLDQVKGYFAVPMPGFIYLVGAPEGWKGPDAANAEHYADWRLFEKTDAIGSSIFYGVFDIPEGQAMFRFYKELSGWDGGDSLGSQADDSPIDFEIGADGSLTTPFVEGKGAFNFPAWPGGEMTIILDMNTSKVTFLAGNQM